MEDPVLVEVLRGGAVESRHRGAVAVVDADGATVLELGNIDQPVFPRSAVKALQALPLVESGAADRFGLTDAELALACASHSGEPRHLETAARMLAKAGQGERVLECGAHWPLSDAASRALAREGGTPSSLHNNCSGKHAGFVCLACAMREEPRGYTIPAHPVQREVRAALEAVTGAPHTSEMYGIDGCGIPTYAVPLRALATGFARFGTGRSLAPLRAAAAQRLRAAVAAWPAYVAGAGRFDTIVMELVGCKAFVKSGAEGVWCAALPAEGLGIALKCDDGARRAAEVVTATLLQRYVYPDAREREGLDALIRPQIRNWSGALVGGLRPAGALVRSS